MKRLLVLLLAAVGVFISDGTHATLAGEYVEITWQSAVSLGGDAQNAQFCTGVLGYHGSDQAMDVFAGHGRDDLLKHSLLPTAPRQHALVGHSLHFAQGSLHEYLDWGISLSFLL